VYTTATTASHSKNLDRLQW